MDDVRVALTVLSFLIFIGIVVWAFSRRRKKEFDEAANLPFSGHEFGTKNDQSSEGNNR